MATSIQVVFDCADPDSLARFWAEAIGYKPQDPPTGYGSWEHWARDQGIPRSVTLTGTLAGRLGARVPAICHIRRTSPASDGQPGSAPSFCGCSRLAGWGVGG